MLELCLIRQRLTKYGTFGAIQLPNGAILRSLELPWRGNKPRVSCIPAGRYLVKLQPSRRFGMAWRLQGVPGRTAILIHPANFATELLGCLALGTRANTVQLFESRRALMLFNQQVQPHSSFILDIQWDSNFSSPAS